MPQTRFWIAIAMPHALARQPRSVVIGRVKRPKLVRMPLVTAAMRQPAITTDDQRHGGRTEGSGSGDGHGGQTTPGARRVRNDIW